MRNKYWIIKIGSSLLTNDGAGIDRAFINKIAHQVAFLKNQNIDVILVSSGAIIEGMNCLGWKERSTDIHKLQAAAAIGQAKLIQTYELIFSLQNIHTAQILLTRENLINEKRYKNISATLNNLIELNVLPIVNENDTVSNEEIKFGDNDTLAALVANLVVAEKLVILTDQYGLFDVDPRANNKAKLIKNIHVDDDMLEKFAGKTSGSLGSGGMYSKVMAAKQAAESNTTTNILWGKEEDALIRIFQGEYLGTLIKC